jgi:hypothetical protein
MTNRHRLTSAMKIYSAQILEVIKQDNFLDIEKLSFDYDRNKVLLNGKPLAIKEESMRFKFAYPEYSFSLREFGDALWYVAVCNSPKIEVPDPLEEVIIPWLKGKGVSPVKTLEIIEECLSVTDTLEGIGNRKLCMRIAKILKKYDYIKKHTRDGKVWIRLEPWKDESSCDH